MAEHNISTFVTEPGRLGMLLREWDEQHQTLYINKRAALAHWRENRANNAEAGEVDPQWPKWSGGCLRKEYLSKIEKVCDGRDLWTTTHQVPSLLPHVRHASTLTCSIMASTGPSVRARS